MTMRGAGARSATCEAAPNIALVKYWGMRDPSLGLPFNSSLSLTLDRLRTRTVVAFRDGPGPDTFRLNGAPVEGPRREAVTRFLDRVRALARTTAGADVDSRNNFPTASGLASSASGFAALAGAATAAAGLALSPRALTQLARLGSGSASRSVLGGFVEWRAGSARDGHDCYATELHPPGFWPELKDVVALIADAPEKAVRSADAMQRSVATAPGYRARVDAVSGRLGRLRRAVAERRAPTVFRLVMEECDEFRSVCETTRPRLDYLTPSSRAVLDAVRSLNADAGETIAGYTHDAGAHVHVFTLARDAGRLRRRLADVPGIARLLTLGAGPGLTVLARPGTD
ncbi:MAG TPA: diphosphomevalonate decarboxylase [Thermoplasmata archaeon]|nr:diphosphomevalonate decarboxylase [Thermoplasmata archaeon]